MTDLDSYTDAVYDAYADQRSEWAGDTADQVLDAIGLEGELRDEVRSQLSRRLYRQYMGRSVNDQLGAIETLNLIDQLHPTKNSAEEYRAAVTEIKRLAVEAIKELRI